LAKSCPSLSAKLTEVGSSSNECEKCREVNKREEGLCGKGTSTTSSFELISAAVCESEEISEAATQRSAAALAAIDTRKE
jgi:hypothetical protein